MKYISGTITDVKSGIICQQVNCKNAYGRGISGILAKKWPEFEKNYRESFKEKTPEELYNKFMMFPLTKDKKLMGANIYTQFGYGDAARNNMVYTDMINLIRCLKKIADIGREMNLEVYVPYGIGCGLAGGSWGELLSGLEKLEVENITAVVLPDDKNKE